MPVAFKNSLLFNFLSFFLPKLLITEDVNVAIRKIAVLLQPDKDITENRDHFIIKNVSTFKNYNMDFVVGQEFEEDLGPVDGRNCMVMAHCAGGARTILSLQGYCAHLKR
uniref:Retinol binding protein 1, cellular, tandem duplicate 1 n=1 Tax=Sinocyclocheilus anshuiensis TaxID=1608454 RepID=A0A671QE56_9TELE